MDSSNQWQRIDAPGEGEAVCFDLITVMQFADGTAIEVKEQGFAIRYLGKLRAWRNHCPHAGSPLDWIPGQFFNADGDELICHTHGARFDPLSGACRYGPCPTGLYPLKLQDMGNTLLVPRTVEGEVNLNG